MNPKVFRLNRRGFIGLASGVFTSWSSSADARGSSRLSGLPKVHIHSAGTDGLYVNSYLFVGETSSTLVDAQLNHSEAGKIIDLIRDAGKPLESIVITHTHPDHYLGLEVIGPAFPEAKIYSARRSIRAIAATSKFWPQFRNELVPITSGRCAFSNFEMECVVMPDAESIAPLVLYLSAERTLIAGDHALHKQHLWLAEGRGVAWLENIRAIEETWNIDQVLPGHGDPGGLEILETTRRYIVSFLEAVRPGKDINTAKQQMLEGYPGYRFEAALDVSLPAYF